MVNSKFLLIIFFAFPLSYHKALSQDDPGYEKQLWAVAFFNWKLNEKWTIGEDFGYQHLYDSPTFTTFYFRSQINRQLTGRFSLHAGINLFYKIVEDDYDEMEIRPWAGAKMRWPNLGRAHIVNYLRLEQRFNHTIHVNDWENNFRVRYKIGTDIPLNHVSLKDKTVYSILSYEFFSSSFGEDIRFTNADTHRFDFGFGYKQNNKNKYEVLLISFYSRDEITDKYSFSNYVLFLKYKRYFNWA